jgi:hypothetical protein
MTMETAEDTLLGIVTRQQLLQKSKTVRVLQHNDLQIA